MMLGSAAFISLRSRANTLPRQSPRSAICLSMSSVAFISYYLKLHFQRCWFNSKSKVGPQTNGVICDESPQQQGKCRDIVMNAAWPQLDNRSYLTWANTCEIKTPRD